MPDVSANRSIRGEIVSLETQVGMGSPKILYLCVRDAGFRIIVDVELTGDELLKLVSGGYVEKVNR